VESRFQDEMDRASLPGGMEAQIVRLKDEEAGIQVAVAPHSGGEIVSLCVRHEGQWVETLYRALDFAPIDGWDGRVPLLFPQVGQCFAPSTRPPSPIPKGSATGWELDGRVLDMPSHGFARTMPWELSGHGRDDGAWAACVLRSSEATRQIYPFDFVFTVTHRLCDGRVVSRYDLVAGVNERPMPFTLGNHISFRAPFTKVGDYGDVRITTRCAYQQVLNEDNVFSGERRPMALSGGGTLSDERLSDIVLAGYGAGEAWALMEDPNSFSMRVSQRDLTGLFSPESVFFVFWGEEDLRYFCPEPWLGAPDALNTGEYVAQLPPGEAFSWEMTIEPGL